MIRLILIFIFAFLALSIHANANSMLAEQTLKSMLPKVCHFSGDFTQSKQIKTLPVPLVSSGEFAYSCDLGLIWETQKPVAESLVFTNKKLHFLVQANRSAENLDGVQHDFLANLLLGLMAGNTAFIIQEFDLSHSATDKNALLLNPKNKMIKQAIALVVLRKTSEKNSLEITITDKNEQTTKILSTEKQQFASNTEFSTNCESMTSKASSCGLLLDPVRISTSGKN